MQSWRRIFYFLLLNVIISAVTTWAVVTIMLRNQPQQTTVQLQPVPLPDDPLVTESFPVPISDDPVEEDEVIPEVLEIESIIGAGELETERVLIKHIGEKEVSLVGWQLQDQDGNVYSFPALTMFQGGAVTVFTRMGTSTVVELFWGQEEPLWQSGDRAYLVDPDGQVHAIYNVP